MNTFDPSISAEALLAERGWMRSLALALLRDAHVADDMVQEAVVAALENPPSGRQPLRPWLRAVLKNRIAKRARAEGVRAATALDEGLESGAASAADLTARLELQGEVVALVRGLDEPYRSTVLRRYFEDQSPSEIAAAQGVPASTVRWRLKVALDRVRAELDERHGGDRTRWASAMVPFLRSGTRSAGGAVLGGSVVVQAALVAAGVAALAWAGFRFVPGLLETPAAELANAPVVATPGFAASPGGEAPAVAAQNDERDAAVEVSPITDELMAFAEREIRRGWREQRAEEIPEERLRPLLEQYEEVVRTTPYYTSIRLAHDLSQAEAQRAGGSLFELLEQVEEDDAGPFLDLVRDAERFAALFEVEVEGPTVDALSLPTDGSYELQPGTTLVLPAGSHDLSRFVALQRSWPRDVTIRGAGMNRTLLTIRSSIQSNLALVNFCIQDLTLHAATTPIDPRHMASIVLDRVRMTGFDTGAGGSNAFDTAELGLLARDCEFLGGFGRSPQHSNLWRTDARIVRFERCRFEQVDIDFVDDDGDSVMFEDCQLVDLWNWSGEAQTERDLLGSGAIGIEFVRSPRSYLERRTESGEYTRPTSRDLSEILPGLVEPQDG